MLCAAIAAGHSFRCTGPDAPPEDKDTSTSESTDTESETEVESETGHSDPTPTGFQPFGPDGIGDPFQDLTEPWYAVQPEGPLRSTRPAGDVGFPVLPCPSEGTVRTLLTAERDASGQSPWVSIQGDAREGYALRAAGTVELTEQPQTDGYFSIQCGDFDRDGTLDLFALLPRAQLIWDALGNPTRIENGALPGFETLTVFDGETRRPTRAPSHGMIAALGDHHLPSMVISISGDPSGRNLIPWTQVRPREFVPAPEWIATGTDVKPYALGTFHDGREAMLVAVGDAEPLNSDTESGLYRWRPVDPGTPNASVTPTQLAPFDPLPTPSVLTSQPGPGQSGQLPANSPMGAMFWCAGDGTLVNHITTTNFQGPFFSLGRCDDLSTETPDPWEELSLGGFDANYRRANQYNLPLPLQDEEDTSTYPRYWGVAHAIWVLPTGTHTTLFIAEGHDGSSSLAGNMDPGLFRVRAWHDVSGAGELVDVTAYTGLDQISGSFHGLSMWTTDDGRMALGMGTAHGRDAPQARFRPSIAVMAPDPDAYDAIGVRVEDANGFGTTRPARIDLLDADGQTTLASHFFGGVHNPGLIGSDAGVSFQIASGLTVGALQLTWLDSGYVQRLEDPQKNRTHAFRDPAPVRPLQGSVFGLGEGVEPRWSVQLPCALDGCTLEVETQPAGLAEAQVESTPGGWEVTYTLPSTTEAAEAFPGVGGTTFAQRWAALQGTTYAGYLRPKFTIKTPDGGVVLSRSEHLFLTRE